jgi:hypothetical protein
MDDYDLLVIAKNPQVTLINLCGDVPKYSVVILSLPSGTEERCVTYWQSKSTVSKE